MIDQECIRVIIVQSDNQAGACGKRLIVLYQRRADRYTIAFFLVLILITLLSCRPVFAGSQKSVLFISSYSENFISVPDQIRGIQSVLTTGPYRVDLEYMDTKRFDTADHKDLFRKSLMYKMQHLAPYDVVIVGDDNALQFAMDNRNGIFKDIPVVFLGINDFSRARKAGAMENITGIVEATPLRENIALALKLNPSASRVLTIVDQTATGVGDKGQFYAIASEYPQLKFEDINAGDQPFDVLWRKLESVGKDTVLLYQSAFQDSTGATLTIDEAVAEIARHTRVPVFRASIGGVGQGLLGGRMVSYVDQGRIAAEYARRIMNGTPVEEIPVRMESSDRYVFDQKVMDRFGILRSQLPDQSDIVNQTPGFYAQHKKLVWTVLLVMAFLFFGAGIATVDNIRRRSVEKQLKSSNEELTALYEELTASEEELRAQYDEAYAYAQKVKEQDETIRHMAFHDALTELPNRFAFSDRLKRVLEAGREGAVLMLDLDKFKEINDTRGHAWGDNVLREVAARLQSLADERMMVSRFGGDEFLLIMEDVHEIDKIEAFAKKVSDLFQMPMTVNQHEFHLSASLGVTRFPEDSTDAGQLIMNADTAMYRVKKSGQTNSMFFNSEMVTQLREKTRIEAILRGALKDKGFKLVYQPKICAETGCVEGFEALLRLRDHVLSPAVFIPVAEEAGLISDIGWWVAEEAIRQLSVWRLQGLPPRPVAINFSARQIWDVRYVDFLADLLESLEVPPELLEIEITESIFLEKTEETEIFLSRLKNMGVRIALDDFGTGYTSLSYLTYIPVDSIKLDKSLIDRFGDEENIRVVESLVALAHSLKLAVVAEGVEDETQFSLLRRVGCDSIQGYFFSRPVEPGEAEAFYHRNFLGGAPCG